MNQDKIEEAAQIGQFEFGYVDWEVEPAGTKERWLKVMGKICQLFEPKPNQGIVCPFCDEDGFDKEGLKYHLVFYCKKYEETENV